jgi:dihydroxyacid dehydratase/phosphogluconate dehydratase
MEAFENAATIVMALGGSTNATIHLIAMARSAGVHFTLEDIQRISDVTPFIADLKAPTRPLSPNIHKPIHAGTVVPPSALSAQDLEAGNGSAAEVRTRAQPSGAYVMEDLHAVGGVPAVMKQLLAEGYLHGDCMTVTGHTIAEVQPPISRQVKPDEDGRIGASSRWCREYTVLKLTLSAPTIEPGGAPRAGRGPGDHLPARRVH